MQVEEQWTYLVDPTLLRRDLGQRLAEDKDVINPEGSDSGSDGRGHNIGRVVGASYPDFEDRGVYLFEWGKGVGQQTMEGEAREGRERTFSCKKTWKARMVR
jgi:hypothetical protein